MIDPGHPFSVPYEQLINSLEQSLREGVEQPDTESFIFRAAQDAYELPRLAYAIVRVSGLLGGRFTVFGPGQDYDFLNNRVIFRRGDVKRPDDGSRFDVEYTYRERPAGLTDFNPGSVVGTLVRVVARELKLLYEQMDQSYRRAFIDVAAGVALDNVVALLGVTRNPVIRATGHVMFFRKTAAKDPVTIPTGTRLAEPNGRLFETTRDGVIGPDPMDELLMPAGKVLRASCRIAEVRGIWRQGDTPETTPSLAWQDTAPKKPFGDDERTVTLTLAPAPGLLRLRYVARSVQVAVQAVEPGPQGNVEAGTVTLMPTPPRGVDGVVNEDPITGGQVAEADDALRLRAKHALDRAGNATLDALRFAVLEIDGVEGVTVIDASVDDKVPVGEVRVRYSTATADPEQRLALRNTVVQVVDRTRAAGILARLEEIKAVMLSGTFYAVPDETRSATAASKLASDVVDAVKGLGIGAPLSVRRLSALAFRVPGLADIAGAQLAYKRDQTSAPVSTDPLLVDATEQIRPDEVNLKVVVLDGLSTKAVRSPSPSSRAIDLQMTMEGQTTPAPLAAFKLDATVTVKARLKRNPELPPERVATFTRQLTFSPAATLTIQAADLTGFRLADHEPLGGQVTIASAAYPGLKGVTLTLDLPTPS